MKIAGQMHQSVHPEPKESPRGHAGQIHRAAHLEPKEGPRGHAGQSWLSVHLSHGSQDKVAAAEAC
jgi:hypothetical protein